MRKGILMGAAASVEEVDIQGLGMQERKNLIERLVRTAEEDNERFLLKLRDRMERVGIDNPTIEVHFENLNIDAEAYVGNRGVPAMTNFFSNKVMDVLSAMHIVSSGKRPVSILHDISGVIRPDRMSLLLGPPGSGKTSLLLALAGKLDSNLKVSGRVTYNGHDMDGFVPQRTSTYIGQHDVHVGKMTVRETLAFFARCQGVGTRYDMLTELSRREKESNIKPDPDVDVYMKAISVEGQESVVTDYILKILGLEICADTMVGDSMIRGHIIRRGRDWHCLHCHIVEQRLVQERRNMLQEKAYVHNSSSLHMTTSFFSLLDSFHFCPLGYKDFPDLALKWRVELMKQDKRAKVLCLHGFCTSESFLKSRSTTGTLPLVMDMGMRIQSYDDQLLHLAADLAQRRSLTITVSIGTRCTTLLGSELRSCRM
uniref:ABC transporter domain-containing protein n=1 Tax=Zea mays TaxID=4577 RepID=A0A804QM51_MAIZE